MKRLGIDLDGVVADYHSYLINDINRSNINGKTFTLEDWTDYSFSKAFKYPKDLQNIVDKHSLGGEFIYVEPIEGAIDAIKELDIKNSIHIITGRTGKAKESSIAWLEKYNIPYDSITFTLNKARAAYILNCDLMIEDDAKQSMSIADAGIEVLLFNKPWNRQLENIPLIIRVNNWKEIVDILK